MRTLIAIAVFALGIGSVEATAGPRSGPHGSICGSVRCVALPAGLADSLTRTLQTLHRTGAPAPAATYLIVLEGPRELVVWLPKRHVVGRTVGNAYTCRWVWWRVPAGLTTRLTALTTGLRPNRPPAGWTACALPRPPDSALGRAEASFCQTENCAQLNAKIAYATGCLNCHTYRGSGGRFPGAPDLTRVGRRMTERELVRELVCPQCVHPGSPMPAFASLPARKLDALASFLAASR